MTVVVLASMGIAVWSLLEVKKTREELREVQRRTEANTFDIKIHRGR